MAVGWCTVTSAVEKQLEHFGVGEAELMDANVTSRFSHVGLALQPARVDVLHSQHLQVVVVVVPRSENGNPLAHAPHHLTRHSRTMTRRGVTLAVFRV